MQRLRYVSQRTQAERGEGVYLLYKVLLAPKENKYSSPVGFRKKKKHDNGSNCTVLHISVRFAPYVATPALSQPHCSGSFLMTHIGWYPRLLLLFSMCIACPVRITTFPSLWFLVSNSAREGDVNSGGRKKRKNLTVYAHGYTYIKIHTCILYYTHIHRCTRKTLRHVDVR